MNNPPGNVEFQALQRDRTMLLHQQQEAERKREELIRAKEKEAELLRLLEEKRKRDEIFRRKTIDNKRDKAIRAKLLLRLQTHQAQDDFLQDQENLDIVRSERRMARQRSIEDKIIHWHSERSVEDKAIELHVRAVRRVFVLLDVNGDGIISNLDIMTRLQRLGCRIAKSEAREIELDLKYMNVQESVRDKRYWLWNMEIYQPEDLGIGESWSPGWSRRASAGVTNEDDEDKDAEMSRDLAKLFKIPPAIAHLREIIMWQKKSIAKIVTVDSIDCSTKENIQHPPLLSPRSAIDLAPQDDYSELVCPVVMTESGLMTTIDLRAHLRKPVEGLNWIEFRDFLLAYQTDRSNDKNPSKLFAIVDFLLLDHNGKGMVDLVDIMELLFQRFGAPSDSLYLKLFGNSFDPKEQVSLQSYLAKLGVLIEESRTSKTKE